MDPGTGDDKSPLREQIEDLLRKHILEGRYRDRKRLPSVRELAARYEVSVGTVANALTNLKREGLLRTRAKKGVFLPGGGECGPRRSKTGNIGVIAQGFGDALRERFYFDVFNGVREAAAENGCKVLYLGTRQVEAEAGPLPLPLGIHDIDGLVYIISEMPSPGFIRDMRKRGLPVVMTDWFDPALKTDGVLIDNVRGTIEVMRHFTGLGHRRIAFINSFSGPSARDRLHGYRQAIEEAGIPFDADLVRQAVPHVMGGHDAMRELLPLSPTAVFAFDDFLALGAILAAEGAGRSVPEDLSVAGFGNQARSLALGEGKRLTSVDVNSEEMGRTAAAMLFRRMDGNDGPPEAARVSAAMVLGDTTAAPK